VYLFPLGARAAVNEYATVVGERTTRGQIKTKQKARELYEAAKANGQMADTALIRSGELWRLWTGPLVHSNWGQLARDAVALLILGAAYEPEYRRRFAVLLLLALPLPAAGIAWGQPWLQNYYGLLGAVYALLALAFLHEWFASAGKPPRWAVVPAR
jgi:membrane associated rhomboid family serine protease